MLGKNPASSESVDMFFKRINATVCFKQIFSSLRILKLSGNSPSLIPRKHQLYDGQQKILSELIPSAEWNDIVTPRVVSVDNPQYSLDTIP